MLYLLTHYWIWLAAAFAVGVVTPLLAEKLGWSADLENYWLQRIGVVFVIAVVLIVARLVSGRPELMLEAGVGLVAAYIVGGIAGGIAPGLLPARFEGWWVGLFATGLILLLFGITTMSKIEPDLRERVAEVVKSAGADPLNFDVSGRDVLLPDDLGAKRAVLSEQIGQVKGVRLVSEIEELSGAALAAKTVAKLQIEAAAQAEAKARAEAEAREAVEKAAAEGAAREAAAKAIAARDATAKQAAAKAKADAEAKAEADAKEAAAKAAAEVAAKEAAAKEAAAKAAVEESTKPAAAAPPAAAAAPAPIKTADAAGTASMPSLEACQSQLSTLAAAQKINFERGSAEIARASLPVLKQLAAVIAQCPAATIEVAGHTDSAGKKAANDALSKRRAEAVADNLAKAGIGSAKLTAVGYGASKPLAGNDSAEGRATNRRIEFVVK
ncbi:OmpA family protein [Rhodopseudomonas palustris]|uniref:OmpA family protein n=1 Tax=Rhodopseudomonas palustris TaxID=1076 RepID=UPI002ACE60D3|nr:OmpA family protein [Rhodopseudomonas palustris]WQH00045.1 OmpA family protein [Rhodopseudomonas palustris]